MRQDNHILALALAWRLAVIGTIPSWADIHDLAQPFDGQNVRVPCDEANRICFAPQRTGWPFLTPPSPLGADDSLSAAPRPHVRDRTGWLVSQDCADPVGSSGSALRSRFQNQRPLVYAVVRSPMRRARVPHGIRGLVCVP